MASIALRDVCVEFPIYNAAGRSLRRGLLRTVGGGLDGADAGVVRVQALRNVDLALAPGDRLALVGHNGAGKSTLLRVLSGAYEPSSGEAAITGRVASLLDITLGMDEDLTGRENIALRAAFAGLTRRELAERMDEIAEFCELGAFLDLPMRTYSSGMALRVAFAVSTALTPDILLIDELIAVGDAGFAAKARARIESLMDRTAILVLASHSAEILESYCNKAIRMEGGRVVAAGTVREVVGG
ncbi:ABC transporter ATP-binding protein [Alsobacter metallidurans]|uniref:ABC transporter ATP-binding protein n=1 Tax=Alsobacter metallidurans TaxID=340221 RepID=A0A917I7F0_9HYPH|nr:ABC transporter ATP-binding protein [Alsobacter metallidurans]GGH22400.1 ABC transporter ATP-binding protein [Alsobacter metallidurans]